MKKAISAVPKVGARQSPPELLQSSRCCRPAAKKVFSAGAKPQCCGKAVKPQVLPQRPQCCCQAVKEGFLTFAQAGATTKPSVLPQSSQCGRPVVKPSGLPQSSQCCRTGVKPPVLSQSPTAVKRASSGVAKHPVLSESREERSLVASQKTFSGVTKPSVLPQSCVESLRCCHKGRTHAVLPQSFKCCEAASAVP